MKLCSLYSREITAEQLSSQNSGCNWSYGDFSKEHCCIKKYFTFAGDCHKCLSSADQNGNYEKECRKIMFDPALPLVLVDKKMWALVPGGLN